MIGTALNWLFGQVDCKLVPIGSPPRNQFLPDAYIHRGGDTQVLVVGTAEYGFRGPGKAEPDVFFPIFEWELRKHNVDTHYFRNHQEFENHPVNEAITRTIIIPIYSEAGPENPLAEGHLIAETAARLYPEAVIFNHPKYSHALNHKPTGVGMLAEGGVDVSKVAKDNFRPEGRIFSLEATGSYLPTWVVEPDQPLDLSRHNAEFIDTSHPYNGQDYYLSLRVMAVGRQMVATNMRCRPVSDGNPNTRGTGMPMDAEMIAYFHEQIVVPNKERLEALCLEVASVYENCFLSHDVMPTQDGWFVVSETGFKFEDFTYRELFLPLAADLPFMDEIFTASFIAKSAKALISAS